MKRYLQLFLFSLCLSLHTAAQPYWNEWINFNQKYFKITLAQNGIYRLDYPTLSVAGVPDSIDSRHFQIFFRGEEQYIYVKDENGDHRINGSDYIEFYGRKNDGSLDSLLYNNHITLYPPSKHPNPYYSLFSDTSAYFLTWNWQTNNRRIFLVADTFYAGFTPDSYFLKEDIQVNHTDYYYGKSNAQDISFPDFHETEGWSSYAFGYGGGTSGYKYTATFNTLNLFAGAGAPSVQLKLAIMGESNDIVFPDHILQVKYRNASAGQTIVDNISFDGYVLYEGSYAISPSLFSATASADIEVTALPGNFGTSRNAVPYVVLKYPHNTNLESKSYYEMYVPDNMQQGKTFYKFTNFNSGNSPVYLYDFTNNLRIPVLSSGGTYSVLVSNAGKEKFCVIKSENTPVPPFSIKPIRGAGYFKNYMLSATDSAYIIITHRKLRGNPGADAYAAYRSSVAGGNHNVLIEDIDELYEQFAYGIPKHPLAIRHFAEYCLDKFPTPPQNLFLIGKSIQMEKCRNNNNPVWWGNYFVNYNNLMIPTLGHPPCDNLLVSVMNGNMLSPAIPIGRIAAKNVNDITTYLNKIKEYEHPPLPNPAEWMKRVIHLSGGNTASQAALFAGYLQGFETIIEDTSFGGYVHSFKKFSSSPTSISFTDSIRKLIDGGVSLITFFGHSSASVFDFNILPPDEYKNTDGKYPFFYANGCVAGNIHEPAELGLSLSELYIFHPRGMIGFLATSGPGTPWDLEFYGRHFYKMAGQYHYRKSVGKIIQATVDTVEDIVQNAYMNATCLEMTLHGDPAIVLHSPSKPDYEVNNASVLFQPSYVSTDMDSFRVNVIVNNLGKATHDSVHVQLKRIFSDGTSIVYHHALPKVFFKDTFTFILPVDPLRGPGLNRFEVWVDSIDAVDELDDFANNKLVSPYEVPLMIYSGDVIPVYPYEYAIVPKDTITLKANTANPFATSAEYIFEIDTTDYFNSSWKKTQIVTQSGSVLKAHFNLWSPSPLVLTDLPDSTVYFWRVRRNDPDTVNFKWRESSFQYISGKRGWGQSHFFQFLKGNKYHYVNPVRQKRYFDLQNKIHGLEIKTANDCQGGSNETHFYINGQNAYSGTFYWWCGDNHVIVAVFDPINGIWINKGGGQFGSFPAAGVMAYEFLTNTPSEQENLRRFLSDSVPHGSKIVLYTPQEHNLGDLIGSENGFPHPGLVKVFADSLGATLFYNLRNNYPYILVTRKGGGTAIEKIADSLNQSIVVYDTVPEKRDNGWIYSEVIGPASKWHSLHWRYHSPDKNNPQLALYDSIFINILGIKSGGTIDTLFRNVLQNNLDIYNLDQTINASIYPYLKLEAWIKDSLERTPAQLDSWRIYYDGVPDASLNPFKHYFFASPTVQQGEELKMRVAVENIGDYDMDSLWVDFWIYDANRNIQQKKSVKMDSLRIDSIVIPEVKFTTDNLPGGLSGVWVEANPFNSEHQIEQYHFNNIGTVPFYVNVDKINPILDVTFDGIHIMNGDIVSAKPNILIKLKDENKFLTLNDPSSFRVFIKHPGKATYDSVHFGSNMTFEPAVLPDNNCKINYTPVLSDGIYELKVQASDRSGNVSGNVEYKVSFEVVNKPSITHVFNYPNPFSTSTRFVFTLTGSKVPDYFKIQILNVTGKVVREITRQELGPIHIGRNITEYAWDGKDEHGDQLANGLYLYRVITQLDGKPLEHRKTEADSFFTHGYGKMYLMR